MAPASTTTMIWIELTRTCQLHCTHCYNQSGPGRGHGAMTTADWEHTITQAADLGVRMVQFIGGEPTLHPGLPDLIQYARHAGVRVEVYTNLVHVPDQVWQALRLPGVALATSFYSDSQAEHHRITGRNTHRQTRANIARAVDLGVPVRAGIVKVLDGQRVDQARAMLAAMGVERIGVDDARPFGRASIGTGRDPAGLCGRCGNGLAAVLSDGHLTPCPMSRWMIAGDVRVEPLGGILARLPEHARQIAAVAAPAMCGPDNDGQCNPCEPSCNPGCDPSASHTTQKGDPAWVQLGTR